MSRPVEHPARPLLSRLFLSGMACWVTGALGYLASEGFIAQAGIPLVVGAAFALGVSLVVLARRGGLVACVLAGALLGLTCAFTHAWVIASVPMDDVAQCRVFELVQDAQLGSVGQTTQARIVQGPAAGHVVELSITGQDQLLRNGQRIVATASLYKPGQSRASYLWQRGVSACARVSNAEVGEPAGLFWPLACLRMAALDVLDQAPIDDASKAVLQALVCGCKQRMASLDVYESFKVAGLAHIVAVSGAHLSIVVMLFECLLKAFGLGRKVRIAFQGAFVGLFLLFAGAPLSAIRAALMAWASLLSFFPGRRSSSLSAIGLLLMCVAAASPASLCSVSLLLSAGSTIGIVLFAPLIQSWIDRAWRIPRFVGESLALTIASGVVSGPISACLFSQVSVVSPLANVLAAPLFALACAVGLALTLVAVMAAPIASWCVLAASLPTHVLCVVVNACAAVPYACLPFYGNVAVGILVAVASAAALLVVWPRITPRALMAGCCACLVAVTALVILDAGPSDPRIVMLDVGQGDAILVQDGRRAILIDTGTNDALLRQALARQGVFSLDAVCITHGDDDHDGSLATLGNVTQVQKGLVARDALTCACPNCTNLVGLLQDVVGEGNVVGLSQGDVLACGRISLEVVWPASFQDKGGNQDSLCLLVRVDANQDGCTDATALLVGDAEAPTLETLLDQGLTSAVDVYKVGHHGSKVAINYACAQKLAPSVALVSVGENNRYGHPSDQALEALQAVQAHVYRTDQSGDVCCGFTANEIKVTTQK